MTKKIIQVLTTAGLLACMAFNQGAMAASSNPGDWFGIKVKTDNAGSSTNLQFTIPTTGSGYDYDVDCDYDIPNTNTASGRTGNYTCEYSAAGTYNIRIKPNGNSNFPRIYFNNTGDRLKIIRISNWGAIEWGSMRRAFYGASNMIVTAYNPPNLTSVPIMAMAHMFHGASLADPQTANWDVSHVTSMYKMFNDATSANPDTRNWDVSNVTSMYKMFGGAISANPDTSNWDTHNVVLMEYMFDGATSANPDVRSWNIESVTGMTDMFKGVTLPIRSYDRLLSHFANQNLQNNISFHGGNSQYCFGTAARGALSAYWTITDQGQNCSVSSDDFLITVQTGNVDAGSSNSTGFTIPVAGLNNDYSVDCDINNLGTNLSPVSQTGDYTCQYAVAGAYQIRIQGNKDNGGGFSKIYFNNTGDKLKITSLDQWGTGPWGSMSRAFYGAENMIVLAQDVPDFSSISSMSSMFRGAIKADPDTTNWDVSRVTTMHSMFRDAVLANPDVSQWETTNVRVLSHMFDGAVYARPDVSLWNTISLKDVDYMFKDVATVSPDLSSWQIESVSTFRVGGGLFDYGFEGIFQNTRLSTHNYDALLIALDDQNVSDDLRFDAGNSNYCSAAAATARNNLINTHNWVITDQGQDCSGMDDFIFVVKTDNPGVSGSSQFTIPTMGGGGYNYDVSCEDDGTIQSYGRTGSYTCGYPAAGIYRIRIIDASGGNTGFSRVFFNNFANDKLKIIDVQQWGAGDWSSMEGAFWGAENLAISAIDTPNFGAVASFENMLRNAKSANPNTRFWDMGNALTMKGMFAGAEDANPDVSLWNVSQVTDMTDMFNGATSVNPNLTTWDIESVLHMDDMFNGVTLLSQTYDAILIAFEAKNEQENVSFHGGNSYYCDAIPKKAILISSSSWQIQDEGQECTPPTPSFRPSQTSGISSNVPGIRVFCSEAGNEIKVYATTAGPVIGSPYNDDVIKTHICGGVGELVIWQGPVVADGYHQIYYTETKYGNESGRSPTFYPLIIDTTGPPPPISTEQNPELIIPLGNSIADFYLTFALGSHGSVSFPALPECQNINMTNNGIYCQADANDLAPGYDQNGVDIEVRDPAGNIEVYHLPGLEYGYPISIHNGSSATGENVHVLDAYVEIIANNPPAGQVFDKWTGSPESLATLENIYEATTHFTMPPAFVEVTATYAIAGDCTGEGDVNIRDVVCAIALAKGSGVPVHGANMDGDSDVDKDDVNGIIGVILND